MEVKDCPECGEKYDDRSALSRKDGKTSICPDCGTRQALDSIRKLLGSGMTDQQWQEYKNEFVKKSREGQHGQNTLQCQWMQG